MKRLHLASVSLLLALIYFILPIGCKKDKSSTPVTPVSTDSISIISMQINQFIWHGLFDAYLWVDQVPNLDPVTYHNSVDTLTKFLSTYSDHEKLFYDLLYQYGTVDKWSWIVNDYVALENFFQGITKSLGYDYMLYRISGGNDVFGVVRYVVKGSPADIAGIKRGDIFIKANAQQITVSNYQSLLVDSIGYTLSFANIVNSTITPNGRQATLNATVVQENPIYYDTIFNVNGYKVGYLVYNGFMSDYDLQLNQVFSDFKSAGINKLILDLRYNGGGSITSAVYLASMIYGTTVGNEFIQYQYNNYLQANYFDQYGSSYFRDNFTDVIAQNGSNPQTLINTLNLKDLYVLTTRNTASASELIINGLRPYILVTTIGDTTDGKYVGSVTMQDYYNYNGTLNPNHKWAMQPIIFKMSNSSGVSDYVNGFAPKVNVQEDPANLLPFGNPNEPMLSAALNDIQGLTPQSSYLKSASLKYKKVAGSKDLIPHSREMYVDQKIMKKLIVKKSQSNSKSIF